MNTSMHQATVAYRHAATRVPPGKAVVLLYDKVLVFLQRAILAAQAGQYDASLGCVTQATTILRGLSFILDFQRGGAIAEMLRTMYTQNILALHRSFGKPDMAERYVKIIEGLLELRDSWAVVAGMPRVKAEEASPSAVGK